MNERIVVDTYAWIEYLDGTKRGEKLRDLLMTDAEVYTSAVTVAEIISKAKRTNRNHETARNIIRGNSTVIDVNEPLSYETGILHAETRQTINDFGLADAYVLATAKSYSAKILTGDPHFRKIENTILL